ncbi:hypothetical protein V9T40_013357 [Parthenolecanium corni]|uniref:Uncharacterized protein n=1 Tax=Parthenolecanium corni TaxID=536013 RepID=A0AAN9TJR3_9HEMI
MVNNWTVFHQLPVFQSLQQNVRTHFWFSKQASDPNAFLPREVPDFTDSGSHYDEKGPTSDLAQPISKYVCTTAFFGQLSQFSSSCLNFRLVVSIFGWMSQFSASCLNFRLNVSIFGQLSQFSSRCLIFRPVFHMKSQYKIFNFHLAPYFW